MPIVDAVFANNDLAITWPMNLDARIVGPERRRRGVAEDHATAAVSQNLTGAGMVRWVKTKSLGRRAGFDERLDYSVGTPGLGATGLEHERDFQGY